LLIKAHSNGNEFNLWFRTEKKEIFFYNWVLKLFSNCYKLKKEHINWIMKITVPEHGFPYLGNLNIEIPVLKNCVGSGTGLTNCEKQNATLITGLVGPTSNFLDPQATV
jgi:hypothetical protein